MSRYGSDEETEAARRRHAQREAEEWARDREETNRMWREGEARRRQERWQAAGGRMQEWSFELVAQSPPGADQPAEMYNAYLDGRRVGLVTVIHRRSGKIDIIVFITDEPGTLDVHYVGGRAGIDTQMIADAFRRQIGPGGAP